MIFERIEVDVSGAVDDRIDGRVGQAGALRVGAGVHDVPESMLQRNHVRDENGLKGSNGIS